MINKYFSRRKLTVLLFVCMGAPFILQGKEVQPPSDRPSNEQLSSYQQLECELQAIPSRGRKVRSNISHFNIPGPLQDFYKSPQALTESSQNWSGYVAVSSLSSPAANSVNSVAGSWIVPSVAISSNDSYCAVWIGIDGFTDGTVEQIGTGHDCVGGVIQHYAWFEMYPGGSYAINGFPVNVGDSISTVVSYSHNGIFTLTIYNNTQSVSFTVPVSYTTSATAQRSSAEWIVEAPYMNGILPLSNFGTIYLTNCTASISGFSGSGGCSSTSGSPIGALPNIELLMVDGSGNLKAVPTALLADQKSFDVAWKHQ